MVDSERLAAETAQAEQEVLDVAKSEGGGYVWLPNATKVRGKKFVEMRTRMNRSQYALFTDEEKTKELLKKPEPGFHYHWARHPQYEPQTGMRVISGLYQYVEPSELKTGVMPMFANHKGVSGTMVAFGTLVLVKESPEAWRETHIAPQVDAIAQLALAEEEFRGGIDEQSKGRAQGTVERVIEKEQIVVPQDNE